jgi:thiol-disulfide isomerase/thioredoxin
MALVITTLVDLWRSPTLPAGAMEAPFTLQDGTTTTLVEQSRGKPLLVYYWASWCGCAASPLPRWSSSGRRVKMC